MSGTAADFTAYAVEFCYASVCTSLSVAAARKRLNAVVPQIDGPWRLAARGFRTGEPNGVPCDRHHTTHRHLLFEC